MTASTLIAPAGAAPAPARTIELVLAHLHLRLASLALARVELETLAGLGGLDTQGLVDLAEVRWRTGDLLGAGEAATAALRGNEADPIALVVAAEAAAAIGRPSEARRLAIRAAAAAPHSIDEIFAGMPRSGVWAADANEPLPTAPTLFDRGPEAPPARERRAAPAAPAAAATVLAPAASTSMAAGAAASVPAGPVALGFWDADGTADQVDTAAPDPAHEFETGRQALVAGSFDEAALHFGIALRLAPALAPAVLEATEGARAASLSVVRGDAYRSAGHESEARQAYAIAARGGLPERRATVRARPKRKASPVAEEPVEPEDIDDVDADVVAAEAETTDETEPAESSDAAEGTGDADDAADADEAADDPPAGDDDTDTPAAKTAD